MKKSELRKIYLERQKGLTPERRKEDSHRIARLFFDNFDLASIRYLHSFIPIEKFNEVDTRPIFEKLWREYPSVHTVVPRVDMATHEMLSLRFEPDTELVLNRWEIHEPAHDKFVDASSIDLVLVPGVCFDTSGHRVGYGKGFYDRFLAKCRVDCVKIGLSFFDPVDSIDDVHDGDVQLDGVITPADVVPCGG